MINDYEARYNIKDTNYATITDVISNDEINSILNNLIVVSKDGEEGYKQAAECVINSALKAKFYDYSQQRAHFAEELQSLVVELGGKPEDAGSVTGAIFRGWMDFKSVLTGKDEGAVLNEVERGEDHAKDAYLKALEKNLPATIHSVINNQFGVMKEAHDHIKLMRDADNKFAQKTSSR
ncbi:MAG: PA2169 family four-helix-bundle protein [Pyrinomonadaceae bacterium]|nr:PA2169 family four-helix-bundle protein [Pyrinomonadaceae bacterium]